MGSTHILRVLPVELHVIKKHDAVDINSCVVSEATQLNALVLLTMLCRGAKEVGLVGGHEGQATEHRTELRPFVRPSLLPPTPLPPPSFAPCPLRSSFHLPHVRPPKPINSHLECVRMKECIVKGATIHPRAQHPRQLIPVAIGRGYGNNTPSGRRGRRRRGEGGRVERGAGWKERRQAGRGA